MKKIKIFCLLFLFLSGYTNTVLSEAPISFEDSFTASTLDEDKFRIYLDTIIKYTYRDNQIVNYCLDECETLFNKELKLSSNDKLKYILILISSGLDKKEPLQSFQLIQDYQHLLDDKEVSTEIKTQFSYLRAYTSFTLQDTKTAQEAFYSMNENAVLNKDTLSMIKAMYSLGQIYSDDENYSAALDYFNKVKALNKMSNLDPSNFCLIQLELSSTHIKLKEYNKALELIGESLAFIEKNKIREFQSDFLLLKGEIALEKKDFETAQYTLDESVAFMEATESYYMLEESKIFSAKLLQAQGFAKPALEIYETLLKSDNELSDQRKLKIYELAHSLCKETGALAKAYNYLMLAKELQMEIHDNKKSQQTTYLKIKFDSAQKDKENQLLAAKVLQKQSQNKLLYALIALSIIGFLLLFGAYYQKQKFAQYLREEVLNRTKELKQSNEELNKTNKELDEFNRILSHDLKEPLRSIVGFSSLVKKENIQNPKVNEYISFIESSGQQLHQIISDVSIFQGINNFSLNPSNNVNPQDIIEGVIQNLKIKYPNKQFKITHPTLPVLFANQSILELAFQNLIENGIVYNHSPIAEIQIRYSQQNGNHVFEFQDNGIGIKPEYHQKVFGMFKRLHNRKEYKGSGLGLSMTKKILEKIEGNITIANLEQVEGSLFEVSFPIIQKENSYAINNLATVNHN